MSFTPTDDQQNFHLYPAYELIRDEINDLKAEGIPASYLAAWLQASFVDRLESEEGAA